jgi:hypothetical protein
LDDQLDRLYQAPLGEFVAARNELAATLNKAGDADGSKRVKALTKPSASAWAVNQLFWKERATFEAMIDAGDALRNALASSPCDAAEHERTAAVGEAVRRARALLEASGHKATEALMRRVVTTLDALASYGHDNPSPMRGRLTEDLKPPGFGAFAALTPALPSPQAPSPEDVVAEHEAAVEEAQLQLTTAEKRVQQLERELTTIQERLLEARRAAERAAVQATEAGAKLEEARTRTKS